jgi:hypothetical protein
VLAAACVEDVEDGVGVVRPLRQAVQGGALEGGQVLAGEEGDEVGGRVDRGAIDALHGVNATSGLLTGCRTPAGLGVRGQG